MISKNDFTDAMFKGTGISSGGIQLWPSDLNAFHTGDLGHVFDIEYDDDMKELEKSILEEGQLEPIIVRPDNDGKYEVIAGHRRLFIADKNRLPLDAVVRNLSDEDAIKLMVLSNIAKRTKIKPMTYAKAIVVYMNANKVQGKRNDLLKTSGKVDTLSDVAEDMGLSRATAKRMMRLVNLIPEYQEQVDSGELPISTAVEISYLSPKEQTDLYINNKKKISCDTAKELHVASIEKKKSGGLSEEELVEMIKPAPKIPKFTLNEKYITTILPERIQPLSSTEKAEYLMNAIAEYERKRG